MASVGKRWDRSSGPSVRSACHVCVNTVGNSSGSKNSKDGEDDDEEKTYLYVYGGYCKHVEDPDGDIDPRDLEDFGAIERAITRLRLRKLTRMGTRNGKRKSSDLHLALIAGASSVVHLARNARPRAWRCR